MISTSHLLCTLLLLHQLRLRPSGSRSWRLGTPALGTASYSQVIRDPEGTDHRGVFSHLDSLTASYTVGCVPTDAWLGSC